VTRGAILGPGEVLHVVDALVDAWCERRCLGALRRILRAYPLASGLTDEWGELAAALKDVRACAAAELTAEELESLGRLAGAVDLLLARRR
jgi:hypothetical protein